MHFVVLYGIQFLLDAFFSFYGISIFLVLYGMRFLLDAIYGDFFRWADYYQTDQRREVKSSWKPPSSIDIFHHKKYLSIAMQ